MTDEDLWDQFTYLWDHTDVFLVRDALMIAHSPQPDCVKIEKLQLLVCEWEESERKKKISVSTADGTDILSDESREAISASQALPTTQ